MAEHFVVLVLFKLVDQYGYFTIVKQLICITYLFIFISLQCVIEQSNGKLYSRVM